MAVRKIKPAVFLIAFFAAYIVCRHVVYFGDDYWFAGYWGQSFFETFYRHYTTETGRLLINALGMLFIKAPEAWKIANSLMLALIVLLSGSIVLGKCRNALRAAAVYAVLIAALLLLDADITRQSVYWISGSVNYVLPFLLFVLLWWGFLNIKKRRAALLPVFAFFAGCSTEQAGTMAVGLCVLYILNDALMLRKKPSREYVFSLILSAAGLLTIFLAPATRLRFGLESAGDFASTGALARYNFKFMLRYFTQSPYTLFAQVFILLSTGLFLYRQSGGFAGRLRTGVKALGLLCLPAAAAVSLVLLRGGGAGALYSAFIWAMRVYYFICGALALYILLRRKPFDDYMIPVAAITLALGSQIMMVISPAIGPRTMLCALLLSGVYAAYMLSVSLGGIKKTAVLPCIAALLAVSLLKLGSTAAGYRATEAIHRENETIITAYTGAGELTQYKFTNEYCWSEPYKSAFHEQCYKRHFGLAVDTVIEWEPYK